MRDLRAMRGFDRVEDAGESLLQTPAFAWSSRSGFVARAVVSAIIGILALKLAVGSGGRLPNQQGALLIDYNPNKAVGLDGALAKLAHNSYGPFLLAVVAAGLIAFALYSLSDARYRRI
jgi:Domain of Unknown Function (DUF1206)